MTLQIKNTISGIKIKDDSGNTNITIKKESVFAPAKLVLTNNKVIYRAAIVDEEPEQKSWNRANSRKYILYKGATPVVVAKLIFAKDAGRLSFVEFPQIERLILQTPYGVLEAARQKDFSVLITDNSAVIGKITPFYKTFPQKFACADRYPADLWAGLYVLVDYMMHEDNLIAV